MARSDSPTFKAIRKALLEREARDRSAAATPSRLGLRRRSEDRLADDYRQAFSLDVDRIMHSLAYTRYIDKTQVFYLTVNDHITHRVLHVQLVSKIARTVGRFLGLNEDLIEAVALGHDIGHPPFGHDGERFLSELCREAGIGCFYHSVQSVQFLDRVERKGRGWNLCLQTLDGILCHDGEVHDRFLSPDTDKTFRRLDDELADKRADPTTRLTPMTLEGCVVRFADTIGYIGRDVDDAIRMGMIDRSDLPASATAVLGETNGTIVFNLVTDLIESSFEQPGIAFSEPVSEALRALKAFNLDRIYLNPRLKAHVGVIRDLFRLLFDQYLTDLYRNNRASSLFTRFFDGMSPDYLETHSDPEIVRDFIAGMTDQYFLRQCPPDRVAKLPTG